MNLAPRIDEQLAQSARVIGDAAKGLATPIAAAAEALVNALFADGKVLVGASGPGLALAQSFVALLVDRFEIERPPIAAIALGADAPRYAAIAGHAHPAEVLAREVQAFGRAGDVLVALADGADPVAIVAAIVAAHEHGVRVVAIAPENAAALREVLAADDVLVAIPGGRAVHVREVQLVALHALAEGIDTLLIGGGEA